METYRNGDVLAVFRYLVEPNDSAYALVINFSDTPGDIVLYDFTNGVDLLGNFNVGLTEINNQGSAGTMYGLAGPIFLQPYQVLLLWLNEF